MESYLGVEFDRDYPIDLSHHANGILNYKNHKCISRNNTNTNNKNIIENMERESLARL